MEKNEKMKTLRIFREFGKKTLTIPSLRKNDHRTGLS